MKWLASAAGLLIAVGGLAFVYRIPGGGTQSPPPQRASSESAGWAVYDPDAGHVWNRLHRSLYARVARDGRVYGRDELDPLLWDSTTHLLSGASNLEAVRRLDEFLDARAERLFTDPLKRAMLQRDLWAVFDWTARKAERTTPALRALQSRLASAVRRLALTDEQLKALPNNYDAAVASGEFAADYDPARPDAPFLPPDLLKPGGSWVEVGVAGVAPSAFGHVAGTGGRSVFRVFVRLPQGRAATVEYLKRVAEFPKAWVRDRRNASGPRPNPKLPQFPAGTRLALVRQMLLANERGEPAPTNVTESVQIRVHRSIPTAIPEAFSLDRDEARGALDVYEFRLSRARLFAGVPGGLRAVARDETEPPVFMSHGIDPFETEADGRAPLEKDFRPVLGSCMQCHFRPGIHSVLTRMPDIVELRLRDVRRELAPSAGGAAEFDLTREWKRGQASWRLLRELWNDER
ncbi:MAG TPA: hypothetical protein VF508_04015 [Pyrinomonadaceae bacterium]